MSKKVLIFGATGMTGGVTLRQAVAAGHEVTAFVRNPELLPSDLQVRGVKGDVLDTEAVEAAVKDQDVVIIALGTRNDLSPTTMMSEGTHNITEAMKVHGVHRVIACLSSFLFWETNLVPPKLQPLTEDHRRMYEVLRLSGLHYVAIMPPHIDDKHPLTGTYKVTVGGRGGRMISKHDLAHFFVRCITDMSFDGQSVSVSGSY